MLFTNEHMQTLSFGVRTATLALHPASPLMAHDQGNHLLVTNFTKEVPPTKLDIHKPLF